MEEGQTVLQIHQLALELVLHDINQSQLAGNALFIILKIDNVYLILKICKCSLLTCVMIEKAPNHTKINLVN